MNRFLPTSQIIATMLALASIHCQAADSSHKKASDETIPTEQFYPPLLEEDLQITQPNAQQKLWALATCAVLTESNLHHHDILGGGPRTPQYIQTWQEGLAQWWDIHNKEELLDTLQWIRTGGHRKKFDEITQTLSSGTSREQQQLKLQAVRNSNLGNRVQIAQKYGDKFGEKSIIAWDFSRYVSLCGWGYIAGYITEEEAWERIMPAARLMQHTFDSWEDLGNNHVIGRKFWSLSQTQKRGAWTQSCYQKLTSDPESPWNKLPWALDLNPVQPDSKQISNP